MKEKLGLFNIKGEHFKSRRISRRERINILDRLGILPKRKKIKDIGGVTSGKRPSRTPGGETRTPDGKIKPHRPGEG